MKLVTFNIRCDCGRDGINNFVFRKPLIERVISEEQPDILCFQEVMPHVAAWLRETLKGYYLVGCGRTEDLRGELVPVAFRADKYNLIEMETYWLSETPYVPASRYPEQSACPRVCTQVLLEELETGKVFRIVNVHLDHVGDLARQLGIRQILKHVDEAKLMPEAPVILTGDFNADPDSATLGTFAEYPEYTDFTAGIGVTFHNYGRKDPGECIDYIIARGGLSCASVEKWTRCEDGVYLSDHYPVCAELAFK